MFILKFHGDQEQDKIFVSNQMIQTIFKFREYFSITNMLTTLIYKESNDFGYLIIGIGLSHDRIIF